MSKKGSIVLKVMALTAAVVTPLVLGGVYLGYYIGGQVGFSGSIMAIAFSTVGFLVAVVVLVKAIAWLVARERPTSSAS